MSINLWPFNKSKNSNKRTIDPRVYKRSYIAAENSRLYNWQSASDRTADGDVKNALVQLRRRSRELVQNEPLAKRYISLMSTQILGRQGIKLQMKSRNPDQTLDFLANNHIESLRREWGRKAGTVYPVCDASGKFTFLDVQRQVLDAVLRDGEAIIYLHDGKRNPHGLQVELLASDRLDIERNTVLQNGNVVRMGIEQEQRTHWPVAYWMNMKEDPLYGTYKFSPQAGAKYERIPAEQIIHVYHSDRIEQSRGGPTKRCQNFQKQWPRIPEPLNI